MSIDCHVHLFKKDEIGVDSPRHRPPYEASFQTLAALASPIGVQKFVLVQTSFMGTNNSHLLQYLRNDTKRFKGVFILEPTTSSAELKDLKDQGMAGIRLNLFGTDLAQTLDKRQLNLIERCSNEGLSVGIHDDACRLLNILKKIDTRATKLVIDHFGRPESLAGAENDPVYSALIEMMAKLNAYVKISAPYRAPKMNPQKAYERLRAVLGPERLLWASDWPWTQHETYLTYGGWANVFRKDKDEPTLAKDLTANAHSFYNFD